MKRYKPTGSAKERKLRLSFTTGRKYSRKVRAKRVPMYVHTSFGVWKV
jgi:hypothetical protein